ncbi:MAG: 2-dehydropantoate 2-reductase [Myxococcota bacterium]
MSGQNHQSSNDMAIVGPGAIGLGLAASLLRKGHRVSLYGRTTAAGFEHTRDGKTESFSVPIASELTDVRPASWVLLTTKAYQTAGAEPWLKRLAAESDESVKLAVVANGVDHIERLTPYWASERILPVIISMPSVRLSKTSVRQRRRGKMTVPDDPAGRAFSQLFDDDVEVVRTEDWTTAAWKKLLVNATLGVCALIGARNGMLTEPPLRKLAEGVLRETIVVGKAAGASFDDPEALIAATLQNFKKNAEHRSSITEDRLNGRPIEWDARNQVVVRYAQRFGVEVPLSEAVASMLAAVDQLNQPKL